MKTIMAFLCMACLCCPVYAQQEFRYQLRANLFPRLEYNYAGASRLEIETIGRRWNYGAGLAAYNVQEDDPKRSYILDSFLTVYENKQYVSAFGFAWTVSRAIPFKRNANRLIYGAQFFSGFSRQFNTKEYIYYDSSQSYLVYSPLYGSKAEKHGIKWNFAVALLARLELSISKRFTFSPELMLPCYFHNKIGGQLRATSRAGFNFCLGYRIGRNSV